MVFKRKFRHEKLLSTDSILRRESNHKRVISQLEQTINVESNHKRVISQLEQIRRYYLLALAILLPDSYTMNHRFELLIEQCIRHCVFQ